MHWPIGTAEYPKGIKKFMYMVLTTKSGVVCVFPTAAGGESTQAPSVFKQAKDKVSVSKISFCCSSFEVHFGNYLQCLHNFRCHLDLNYFLLNVIFNCSLSQNNSWWHPGMYSCLLDRHVMVVRIQLGCPFISKTKQNKTKCISTMIC